MRPGKVADSLWFDHRWLSHWDLSKDSLATLASMPAFSMTSGFPDASAFTSA